MKIPPNAFDEVLSEIRFRCSQCHGSGVLGGEVCPHCNGAQSRSIAFSPTTEDTEDLERVDEIDRDEDKRICEESGEYNCGLEQDPEKTGDHEDPEDGYQDNNKYKVSWDDEDGIPF